MIRKAVLVLSGNATMSILMLLRTILVARLIPVEDYGIAVTFALAMAIVEMMSALGLHQQLIQSERGDEPRFQAALHGFQVLRGSIAALSLVAIAVPLARFLRIEEAAWGMMLLALVPFMNSLAHFDMFRFQRRMRYGPIALQTSVPALLSLLSVWPLATWLGDWRVMLFAILIQAGFALLISHLVAERPFRIVLDREIMAGSLRFGWPILVNGVLMFLTFNGDRLIVGRELGMAVLGVVSMGYTLTLTPTLVLAKTSQSLFLPKLSHAARTADPTAVRWLATTAFQTSLLVGSLLLVGTVVVIAPLVGPVLGSDFASLVPLLPLLAAIHGVRVFKEGPSVVALSYGRSVVSLFGNIPRAITLLISWWALVQGHDIVTVLQLALIGEAMGCLTAYVLTDGLIRLNWRPLLAPVGIATALMTSAAVWPDLLTSPTGRTVSVVVLALQLFASQMIWQWIRRLRSA